MAKSAYIVTGARTGIGRAVTQNLLENGFEVVGISRSIKANEFAQPYFHALAVDLSDLTQIKATFKQAETLVSDLRGVVFCAGKGLFASLEQLSAHSIQKLIDLNLTSPILSSQYVLPLLKRNKRGHLVFIGSEAALQGGQKGTAYCASKFGLRGFTQALKQEASSAGIKVTLINPGMVNTPFFDKLHFRPGKAVENSISAETVAETVLWAIQSPVETQIDEINLSPSKKVIDFK